MYTYRQNVNRCTSKNTYLQASLFPIHSLLMITGLQCREDHISPHLHCPKHKVLRSRRWRNYGPRYTRLRRQLCRQVRHLQPDVALAGRTRGPGPHGLGIIAILGTVPDMPNTRYIDNYWTSFCSPIGSR